jgi:integrase
VEVRGRSRRVGASTSGTCGVATRERAGITAKGRNRLNPHDLRGEFGSELSDAGIPIKDISLALGHSTTAATEAYLRPRVAHLDDAHERLQAQRAGKVLRFTNRFTRKPRKSKKTA